MNWQIIERAVAGVTHFFSPEWVRAALVVALVSSVLVAAVCAYLGRSTKKMMFVLWTGGWSFYSIYLVTLIVLEVSAQNRPMDMARLVSAGLSALMILWGGLHLQGRTVAKWKVAVATALVMLGSYVAVYVWERQFWGMVMVFVLLAGASVYTGVVYRQQRNRPAIILAMGFVLWGAILFFLPLLGLWPVAKVVAYMGSAALALAVALGMIVREEAVQSEQSYRDVLDAANTAIFVVDLWTLNILDANRAAQRLVRRSLTELGQLPFADLCPDLQHSHSNLLDHRAMFNAVFKPYNEVQFIRPDGSPILCEGDTHLIQWRNRPALQINLREVDKEKKVGQLVRRAEKMSSLGQLIAGVAHELNNPLAVVVAYAQLMAKQKTLDDKARGMTEKILHESERAAKIVRDLLTFARPCEPQMTTVDINRLIANVMEIREADLRSNHVETSVALAADLPRTKADPIQIEQVLTNLITNAIHAMIEHGTERRLRVTTESTGFHIRITVADSGPGIPAEVMGRIFDPFFTTKAPGKGTGLGLSISNTIMQEHRGKIWAQSEPGKGAQFFVELPVVHCEAEEETTVAAPAEEAASAPATKQRILVVDDEPGIRDVLGEVLRSAGYVVDTASSGVEALEQLNAKSYDLIISDLAMPVMDGEKLYQSVREQIPSLARRMVFLTGDTVSPKSRTFLETTGNRWLTKPFNISDVESVIRSLLKSDPLQALTDTTRRVKSPQRYHPSET